MTKITFEEAKEFLKNISDKDNIAIIHHDDGDGFCSGILFYDWCKLKGAKVKQFDFSFGKWKKKTSLEPFNKIIITDIAPDGVNEINPPLDKEILSVDHHPEEPALPKEILDFRTEEGKYIPSSRTAGELTELKPWLALIGTVTDRGELYVENQDFIDDRLKEINMKLEDFKQNVSNVIINFLVYFDKDTDKAFKILEKIKSIKEIKKLKEYSEPVENEIEKFVEEYDTKKERLGDVNYYYFEPQFSIKVPVSTIISDKDHDGIYIFASPKKDEKKITLSARNTSQKIDMAKLLQAGIEGLKEATAGGHKAAAGARILAKDIKKFKANIRNYVKGR